MRLIVVQTTRVRFQGNSGFFQAFVQLKLEIAQVQSEFNTSRIIYIANK